MTRIIGVLSGKGGVGKTTLVSNLSHSLTELGYDVTAMDANLTTPHLGMHLGMHLVPKTLHDVLRGIVPLKHATYSHPLGFKVIPGSLSINDLTGVDIGKLPQVASSMSGKTDFLILDSAPALGREAMNALQSAEEVLLITTPDLPSVADALKTMKVAQSMDKKVLGVVVNRVKGRANEMPASEIQSMLKLPILAEIPEDINVHKSLSAKRTLADFAPESSSATEIKRLAYHLTGKEVSQIKISSGFLEWLVGWMSR